METVHAEFCCYMEVDVGVTRPNVIRPDFDLECRQVNLSRRLGGNLTSPDLEKNRLRQRHTYCQILCFLLDPLVSNG